MNINLPVELQVGIGIGLVLMLLVVLVWLFLHRRPTAEEMERRRRTYLAVSGRIVDGMLLDFCESDGEDGAKIQLLVYNYRISGVDYECSQDVSPLGGLLKHGKVRAGFPCSVRYQPGNPQNSIVVAESWSGLREGIPVLPNFENPDPLDIAVLKENRG
jgi:hypothetical protein